MSANEIGTAARLDAVSKRYGASTVLDQITLHVRPGAVTALLGPNGAGKTTAIGVLTGRLSADTGEARLFGLDARETRARARMGVMLQSAGLPDVLTVRELVTLQSGYFGAPRAIAETIDLAGLSGLEQRRAGKLSGGQQRRLNYALALCGRPDLLVLDEPTTGLDHEARRRLWSTIREEAARGAAILLTTHYLEEADALADRVVVIAEGRIVADGTPAAIKSTVCGSTIRCRTSLADPVLAGLPGVRRLSRSGAAVTLMAADSTTAARALLGADSKLTDLTISAASLEDALADISSSLSEAA